MASRKGPNLTRSSNASGVSVRSEEVGGGMPPSRIRRVMKMASASRNTTNRKVI